MSPTFVKSNCRFDFYERLQKALPRIVAEASDHGRMLGIDRLPDKVGLYPGASSCPGQMPSFVLDAIVASNRADRIQPMQEYQEELRYTVKSIYGDAYDAVALNTCEAALRIVHEVLFAPPTMRKGDAYRARFLTMLNEDFEYLSCYGRPFPPKYKGLSADRSVAAGEFGVEAKALTNLDALMVRFAGGRYEVHGIKPNIVPMLQHVDIDASIARLRRTAERHGAFVSGFSSIGYDTPGYGHQIKNDRGAPLMLEQTSAVAREFDVPHFVDCGGGLPVIGYGLRDVDADIMAWSMDKAGRAPVSGLLVGREAELLPIRQALGVAGPRFGGQSSHGKALYAFADPGRDALIGLIAYLRVLRDNPKWVTDPIDQMHDILVEEFNSFALRDVLPPFKITKSYAWGGTEINYEESWSDLPPGRFGIPISTLEDFFANTNAIVNANVAMGVSPATIYSGNMFVTPGLGTLDADGQLIVDRAVLAAKALVKSVEIVCRHAGVGS
jgi:hypothetical protein